MENPASWKAVHHGVSAIIEKYGITDSVELARQIIVKLKQVKYLPESLDAGRALGVLTKIINEFHDTMEQGLYGASLVMQLGDAVEWLKENAHVNETASD